jgi:predicted amidophosphoribosyltransferase
VAWSLGDALWDYHGGRPPFGALLVPGIKEGELGWKGALLRRVQAATLPEWTADVDLVTWAPTALHRRWFRAFDLAEESARLLARRLDKPVVRALRKAIFSGRQASRTETQRRRLAKKSVALRADAPVLDSIILLVDDVWTTGTTLLRCAQALESGGAAEVRVLTLFRAL